ncbi:hypothetical protein B0H14DRAFT_1062305 [Mycena olivaceomarginata]|nr:hypothetical protein B0H14DRAFT_1062305 [Mycena olivaceomarginata]
MQDSRESSQPASRVRESSNARTALLEMVLLSRTATSAPADTSEPAAKRPNSGFMSSPKPDSKRSWRKRSRNIGAEAIHPRPGGYASAMAHTSVDSNLAVNGGFDDVCMPVNSDPGAQEFVATPAELAASDSGNTVYLETDAQKLWDMFMHPLGDE